MVVFVPPGVSVCAYVCVWPWIGLIKGPSGTGVLDVRAQGRTPLVDGDDCIRVTVRLSAVAFSRGVCVGMVRVGWPKYEFGVVLQSQTCGRVEG